MIERDKQVDEQQKKHQAEKEHQHPQKDFKSSTAATGRDEHR